MAFLESIPLGASKSRWQRVGRVQDLTPGDVVVWLKPPDSTSTNTSHTMIVHGALQADAEPQAYIVPVADSTEGPHGAGDTRSPTH